jgi:hypothetical protein
MNALFFAIFKSQKNKFADIHPFRRHSRRGARDRAIFQIEGTALAPLVQSHNMGVIKYPMRMSERYFSRSKMLLVPRRVLRPRFISAFRDMYERPSSA